MPRKPKPIHLTVLPSNEPWEQTISRFVRATEILMEIAQRTDAVAELSTSEQFLCDLGFEDVGRWFLLDGVLSCELRRHGMEKSVLYAFVSKGRVLYIGKSIRTLSQRMYGYQRPGPSQSTNIANHRRLVEILEANGTVTIYVFAAKEPVLYGGVPLNLASGLEDPLIERLRPPWNGRGMRPLLED